MSFPPTIIVIHPKERRSKCSVEPLRGREDCLFVKFPRSAEFDRSQYVRLSLDGPQLSLADQHLGLLVLDGTWRLAQKMESGYTDVAPRSLPPWNTAYPRTSKLTVDPSGGLATIEAIYLSYLLLGRDTSGLLDAYHWKDDFVEMNLKEIRKFERSK